MADLIASKLVIIYVGGLTGAGTGWPAQGGSVSDVVWGESGKALEVGCLYRLFGVGYTAFYLMEQGEGIIIAQPVSLP